ncbi:MAG: proline dehydrogenase [Actinomycetota bacterium]|nr:proline dehydrogenase [Actinomycetota bacterium]
MLDPSGVLRHGLLQLSKSDRIRDLVERAPVSRDVVTRFVAGESTADAVRAARELALTGRLATIDHLGEDTLDLEQARATRDAYLRLLASLGEAGLAQDGKAEVSLKLSAVGQALGADGAKIALEHTREICQGATNVGTSVTLDMEDHSTTDATLEALRELRQDFPTVGAVLQAYLYRTEADCRDLAYEGSRVRLCKGAYKQPESVAFQGKGEVDKSYVRCLKVLMEGQGYPMVATHDPRLVEIAGALANKAGRAADTYEYQMLYGIRPTEQKRIADSGDQLRVYIPYGQQWYGYLVRRMAERPANTMVFLRGLATKS